VTTVTVSVPGALRAAAGGESQLTVQVRDGACLRDVLDVLDADRPLLGRRLRDETGRLRRHVNVYVGDTDVRDTGVLATPVPDGAAVLVLPSVAGGSD
jgi:sulfur-carrier protein